MNPPDTSTSFTRTRPELLAPAGGPEPLYAALAAGADAIYCGMGGFNARRKAENFSDEDFEQACRAAHLAGARVYVTVNVVIKDDEMAEALALVARCWELGADAFIIQDWGLFFEIRRLMPEVETHISTQANIHDARGAAWCRAQGADRVTLSRELSVAEIAEIAQAGIELEVFAHGAICFCYSGLCTLSSFTSGGRSANRGMCAQPCRLPYELLDENGHVLNGAHRERALCPRDTCTAEMLPELLAAGAHALKLEGRMKAPDYVFSVVSAYRAQLDDVLAGRKATPEERERRHRQLKRCFNRDFTCEYQHGRSGNEMMSYERSNNRGQLVGRVLGSRRANIDTRGMARDDRRRKLAVCRIELDEPIGKGDLLELRHDDEFDQFLTVLAPADAQAGEIIECTIPRAMPVGSRVRVIRSQAAFDASDAALKQPVARRRRVHVAIRARLGESFAVTLTCCDDESLTASAEGFTVEPARTKAVTREDLIEHVGRMGSSPFEAADFDVELDEGCGMGFSAVHKVRAAACEALEAAILAPYRRRVACLGSDPQAAIQAAQGAAMSTPEPVICALATSLEAVDAARQAGADRVYMAVDDLLASGLSPAEAAAREIIPVLDEVSRELDHERLDPWIQASEPAAVGTISELVLAAERGAAAELRSCIPVHNAACLRALAERGAHAVWLSPELTLAEIETLAPQAGSTALGLMVIGAPRVMTSEHCILQVADACVHDCAACKLRRRAFRLKNIDGRLLPVRTALNGRSRLYADKPIDATPQIPQLMAAGVSRFLVDGTLNTPDELARLVARTRRALDAAQAGRTPAPRMQGATSGCLFTGIS